MKTLNEQTINLYTATFSNDGSHNDYGIGDTAVTIEAPTIRAACKYIKRMMHNDSRYNRWYARVESNDYDDQSLLSTTGEYRHVHH